MFTFCKSGSDKSLNLYKELSKQVDSNNFDSIIALGGDGHILDVLHKELISDNPKPVFGINCGTVGFLLNEISDIKNDLSEEISNAQVYDIFPLKVEGIKTTGEQFISYAFNDVYVNRSSHQAAKLKISVNDIVQIETFIGDGIIVSSEIGSTAYNRSAGGPIIPIGSGITAITPICGFVPKHWSGAIIRDTNIISVENIEYDKRPLTLVADSTTFEDIKEYSVTKVVDKSVKLLFNKTSSLHDKFLIEQFSK